jgi:serine/threonine protein kinase/Flp pilus assembly protein TadD
MNNDTSVFGVPPEKLDRLILSGLEPPAAEEDGTPTASVDMLLEKVGSWIHGYRLIDVLGEGGMGMVYLAEQTAPMRRRVALKVVKPGMDSRQVVARFESERQALALLDHPNIAHVYDAGTTDSGRPYFVMEHVKGLPITAYCDRHKLTIEERLRLFQQVCDAVQHAHQKGIIHRDLKPSNILVSTEGDEAIPKIIDFGVAKAITQPLTERTLFTEDGHLLGTPEYMSPEQADMANEDIDTRSDIYSLGVLLYELLTGILPYDSQTFREGGIEHIRKTIRETDPKTPSTRLAKLGEEAEKLAESRRTEVATLAKRLHTELEWIPLKAMRKDRSERYRSASELADDIENYLKGAPLIAGPPSTLYRLKKSVRRHKTLVGGTVSVVLVSVVGTVVSVMFALGQARARAESQAVTDFLAIDVLRAVRGIKGRDATVADVLNVASKNLDGKFDNQPIIEAQIRWHLGMAYRALGDYGSATDHLVRSYQLRRIHLGEQDGTTRYTKNYLALEYSAGGHYREAEHLFDELIESSAPGDTRTLPGYKCNLACVYIGQGRYEEAERLFVETLSTDTPWWEWWSPKGKPYLGNLAKIYLHWGRYDKAEKLFDQFLKDQGEDALAEGTMSRLGYLYMAEGRDQEAEDWFTRGIEYGNRELPGKDHPTTLTYMNGLAVLNTRHAQYSEAEHLFKDVLEIRKRKLGTDDPFTLETLNDFGVLRREQQRYDEAESLIRQALEARQRELGPNHPACFESMHELGVLYLRQARYEDAEPLLLEAYRGRQTKFGPEHRDTIESLQQLVTLYESWPKPDEADKWRAKLPRQEDPRE